MFAGVTYNYFIINFALTTELFLITGSWWALPAALGWLQGTLLGNVATAVAVMAVAAVGFMMLTGRLNWRFGATVIIGVFILFGAASIVAGIQGVAGGA
jgi:type IV secretory pathway VirB2 component (pilin)